MTPSSICSEVDLAALGVGLLTIAVIVLVGRTSQSRFSLIVGAAEFEAKLPDSTETCHAIVILRLRGRDEVGSTFVRILDRYARALQAQDSKLMLVGIGENLYSQLEKTRVLHVIGRENVFMAKPQMASSLMAAHAAALAWLAARERDESPR